MARIHAIKPSGSHIDINYVLHKKTALERAVILKYSTKNPDFYADFVGLSENEIEQEKTDHQNDYLKAHGVLAREQV